MLGGVTAVLAFPYEFPTYIHHVHILPSIIRLLPSPFPTL